MSGGAIDTLARTVWGEARGEPDLGRRAVAAVVMNRLARPGWWSREPGDGVPDDTVEAVCRDPFQFSCWNPRDPNRSGLLAVTAADPVFARCLAIAARAVGGDLPDPTGGATHYHAAAIPPPAWTARLTETARIGRHIFYR